MIDELDKKIIGLVQNDLPLDPSPFALLADKIGITEDQYKKDKIPDEEGNYPPFWRHSAPSGGRV